MRPIARAGLVLRLVSRIIIRSDRLELGGTRIHQLENGADTPTPAIAPNLGFGRIPQCRELTVRKAVLLRLQQQLVAGQRRRSDTWRSRSSSATSSSMLARNQGSISSQRVNLVDTKSRQQGVTDPPDPLRVGSRQVALDLVKLWFAGCAPQVFAVASQAETARLPAPAWPSEAIL